MDDLSKIVNIPFTLKLLRKLPLPHKYGVLDKLFGRQLAIGEVALIECADGITWKLDLHKPSEFK